VIKDHLARGDFRRWIEDVFGDRELSGAILRLERGDVSSAGDGLRRANRGSVRRKLGMRPSRVAAGSTRMLSWPVNRKGSL
jgi:hypothetical protein